MYIQLFCCHNPALTHTGTVLTTRIVISPQAARGCFVLPLARGQEMPAKQPVAWSRFPTAVCHTPLDCIQSGTQSSLELVRKSLKNLKDVIVTVPQVGEMTPPSPLVAFRDFTSL